jgi:hypothetical protein
MRTLSVSQAQRPLLVTMFTDAWAQAVLPETFVRIALISGDLGSL